MKAHHLSPIFDIHYYISSAWKEVQKGFSSQNGFSKLNIRIELAQPPLMKHHLFVDVEIHMKRLNQSVADTHNELRGRWTANYAVYGLSAVVEAKLKFH